MSVFPLGADSSVRLGGGAAAPRGALCERLERWGRTETVPQGPKGAWEGQDGVVSPLSVSPAELSPQQVHSDGGHIAHAGSLGEPAHSRLGPRATRREKGSGPVPSGRGRGYRELGAVVGAGRPGGGAVVEGAGLLAVCGGHRSETLLKPGSSLDCGALPGRFGGSEVA